jgi:hypothetical protein
MKKTLMAITITMVIASCKSSKAHCDAYSKTEFYQDSEFDISKQVLESQKKYQSCISLR